MPTRIDDELAYHPGSRRPRRKGGFVALARQCGAQFIIQHYSGPLRPDHDFRAVLPLFRSEEHTSELQSLMRNSYAVFCLTKKKTKHKHKNTKLKNHNNNAH